MPPKIDTHQGCRAPFGKRMVPRLIVYVAAGEVDGGVGAPAGRTVLYSVTYADRSGGNLYIYRERIDRSVIGCHFFAGGQRQLESGGVLRVPACEFKRLKRLLTEQGGLNTPAARLGSQLARRCGNKTRK